MNAEKLSKLEELKLSTGSHVSFEKGACIMEMVSYMADEPWSDQPKCACPILTRYAIALNDRFNDEHRQRLKPFIPVLIGTKSTDEVQIARKRLLMWRNVTALYPTILESLKLTELADKLRSYKNSEADMLEASEFLKKNRELIKKTYYANAYAYANANAYADAYAYANADANADAYANAWREKIAAIAIETLRLACEVK